MGTGLAGIGVDAIEVARVRKLLQCWQSAEDRLFTEGEAGYCRRFADPYPRYAARFAAKEAVAKALGTGIISWVEIEVLGGGKPRVALHGRTAQAAAQLGITRVELSLSHTVDQAYAVAAAVKEGDDV